MMDAARDEDAQVCSNPCDPSDPCEECAEYWDRMRREGFWTDGRWTEKGWREIMRHA